MGVHAHGLALTLCEALLRLLPVRVLFSLLLGVLLGGLIVGGAADGGVPIEGLRWLLQGTTGSHEPWVLPPGERRSGWETRREKRKRGWS